MNFERMAVRFQQRIAEQAMRYEGDLAIMAEEKAQAEDRVAELEQQLAQSAPQGEPKAAASVIEAE